MDETVDLPFAVLLTHIMLGDKPIPKTLDAYKVSVGREGATVPLINEGDIDFGEPL